MEVFVNRALQKCMRYQENCYTKLKIRTIPDILMRNPKILTFFLTFCNISQIPKNVWHSWECGHHVSNLYPKSRGINRIIFLEIMIRIKLAEKVIGIKIENVRDVDFEKYKLSHHRQDISCGDCKPLMAPVQEHGNSDLDQPLQQHHSVSFCGTLQSESSFHAHMW